MATEWDPGCSKVALTRQVCTGTRVPGHSPVTVKPPFTRFSYNIHSSLYKGNKWLQPAPTLRPPISCSFV